MSCPNFSRVNARNFYVIYTSDTDDEGNEYVRDEWDLKDITDSILERISDKKYKAPYLSNNNYRYPYNNKMDAGLIAENEENWFDFGNGKCWPLQTRVDKYLYIKDGYYSGCNLDWDIKVSTSYGDDFRLSEYDSIDYMIKDILEYYLEIIDNYGDQVGWNRGTFNFQKKNIEKWIRSLIDNASDELDEICKNNCEDEFYCAGIFSNGEAIYRKIA